MKPQALDCCDSFTALGIARRTQKAVEEPQQSKACGFR
jgi:hypothetical protein